MSWREVGTPAIIPEGAYSGLRAANVQLYDDSNKKLGSAWGGSRRLANASLGQKFYTVIKTRSLPIDLKSREFSYTGNGVIGRFYTGFTPQNLSSTILLFNGLLDLPL